MSTLTKATHGWLRFKSLSAAASGWLGGIAGVTRKKALASSLDLAAWNSPASDLSALNCMANDHTALNAGIDNE